MTTHAYRVWRGGEQRFADGVRIEAETGFEARKAATREYGGDVTDWCACRVENNLPATENGND